MKKEPMNEYKDPETPNYNKKDKCKKVCRKPSDNNPLKLEIDLGWHIEGIFYAIVANFILGAATLISIILRK